MKKKGSNKKNIIIFVVVGLVVIFAVLFFLNNSTSEITLTCKGVEGDENASVITNFLIKKKGKKIHINYTGEINFFTNNEFAMSAISIYVENQVSKIKEYKDANTTLEKTKNKISYTFDFDMNSLSEKNVKEILGIYSYDIIELRKHFENGGLTCEES